MQTRPFRNSTENSDIIKQHARVAPRADETRAGYVCAIFDDGTALVKFDDSIITDIVEPDDLILLAVVANDPAQYTSTLI
jgi:hypothetical protein